MKPSDTPPRRAPEGFHYLDLVDELYERAKLQAAGAPGRRVLNLVGAAGGHVAHGRWKEAARCLYDAGELAWRWGDMKEHGIDYPAPEELEIDRWEIVQARPKDRELEFAVQDLPHAGGYTGHGEEQDVVTTETEKVAAVLCNRRWRMGWSRRLKKIVVWERQT